MYTTTTNNNNNNTTNTTTTTTTTAAVATTTTTTTTITNKRSNFVHTGDPNSGPCNNSQLAPVAWPVYRDATVDATTTTTTSSSSSSSTLVLDTGNATASPAALPTRVLQDLRADKCALFMPLVDAAWLK